MQGSDQPQPAPLMIEDAAALLAAIVASSSDAILSKTLDGVITSWNTATEELFGYSSSEIIGQSIRRLIPADRQNEEDEILARISAGERIENYETVRVHKNGNLIEVSVTISPVRGAQGEIIGASKIIRDITERRRAERRIKALMSEVNHRTKNLLGLVQAIARQTAAAHPTDFLETFDKRLQALAANQDLLISTSWRGVGLRALVEAHLQPFADAVRKRVSISGPDLVLSAQAGQDLGMAMHELMTNAAKYGALSNDAGEIDIAWTVGPDEFAMTWNERGGPAVTPPQATGFGAKVLKVLVPSSLNGASELTFGSAGVSWRLACPCDSLVADASSSGLA
ncbi:MAG: PAS domain S-box protein [Hyphomonadaceae bacterium]